MKGDRLSDGERCRSMTLRGAKRCPNRKTRGDLCEAHAAGGALVPDDWTQPDNLPVFALPTIQRGGGTPTG